MALYALVKIGESSVGWSGPNHVSMAGRRVLIKIASGTGGGWYSTKPVTGERVLMKESTTNAIGWHDPNDMTWG